MKIYKIQNARTPPKSFGFCTFLFCCLIFKTQHRGGEVQSFCVNRVARIVDLYCFCVDKDLSFKVSVACNHVPKF